MFRQSTKPSTHNNSQNTAMSKHEIINRLLRQLAGVYREPSRILNDSVSLLNSTPGKYLNADIHNLTMNDGTNMRCLRLNGLISMIYRGNTYNIPVDIYLPPNYAIRPPTIFVRPVSSMMIKEGHKHVGPDGMVYMPYLHSWNSRTHNLIQMVVQMSTLFGEDPPVFARPNNGRGDTTTSVSQQQQRQQQQVHSQRPQPPPQYQDVRQEQERIRQIEKETFEANEAVRIAREAEQKEKMDEYLHQSSKRSIDQKAFNILEQYVSNSKQEIGALCKDQILLEKSDKFINGQMGQMQYFLKRKEELLKHHDDIDRATNEMKTFLEQASKAKTSINDISVDDLALPTDLQSAQMLVLSAENAAIRDALYTLDKGLSEKVISLDVHLEAVRRVSKRQFLIRAHLLKIGQKRASHGFSTT